MEYLGTTKSGQKKNRTPVSSAILKLNTDNFLDYWPLIYWCNSKKIK